MVKSEITDPTKAQAAIAYLISEGWKIDLHELKTTLPGGLQAQDWLDIANKCLDFVMDRLAEDKVIPISRFKRTNA